ncbi:methyltransferase domain-containing protein [Bacteroidetes/Chlorobi group bacterium ChocPot_Mid]|nr:MAG: methyltransferase domain-containing protein [Bacteroidetes/Chlorobi group bacterium ChocPot_Mid]
MASLSKTYTDEKLSGKVYTPRFVVEKILDDINFTNENILGKTLLDPACGDGRFLIVVAERIIKYSTIENLKENLEKIYGWDIDQQAINECIQNLNELIKDYNLTINWNIKVCNSIEKLQKFNLFQQNETHKFDFIIGNPPYIRIQHLEETQRKYIQHNYMFCQNGSTDIYIAFFELCYNLLSEVGICGLITPNTYFYTETAKLLRENLVNNKSIKQITNYAEIQLFANATTYSAITIFNKQTNESFLLQLAINPTEFKEKVINISELKNQKFWQLTTEQKIKGNGRKLKEICNIHVGITTLSDKSYIFPIEPFDENYVFALTKFKGKVKIEKQILKPIVKGSTLKNSNEPIKEYVLFPFKKVNGKHQILQEDELKNNCPLAYKYLLSIKDELSKRDNGNPINPWYNFGRTQSLDTSFGKKIIFSPMNKTPNFILYENEESTFYSGYCIKYSGDYNYLLQQLNSDRMQKFIEMSSRDFRGGWKSYNKKIIEEFIIE